LIVKYGLNKQDGIAIRKQKMPFNSIRLWISKDTISTWYHSAKLSFNTQFTNGFTYPNTEKSNSKPLLQLIFMGVGAENIDKEKEEYFISRLLH
jgi:hypothetical protein